MKRFIVTLSACLIISTTPAHAQYYNNGQNSQGPYTTNNLGGGVGIVNGPNGYQGQSMNLGGGVQTYNDNANHHCTTTQLGGGMSTTNCY